MHRRRRHLGKIHGNAEKALIWTLTIAKGLLFSASTFLLAAIIIRNDLESLFSLDFKFGASLLVIFGIIGAWWIPGAIYYVLFVNWNLFEKESAVAILFADLFITLLFGVFLVLLPQVFSSIAFAWSGLSFVGIVFASALRAVPELKRPVMVLGILQLVIGFALNFGKISLGIQEIETLRTILTSTGAITTLAGMGRKFEKTV